MNQYAVTGGGTRQQAASKFAAAPPEYTGRHVWVFTAAWVVQNPARTEHNFDMENLLTLVGPGCWHCEQAWKPTIGAKCPGDPAGGEQP